MQVTPSKDFVFYDNSSSVRLDLGARLRLATEETGLAAIQKSLLHTPSTLAGWRYEGVALSMSLRRTAQEEAQCWEVGVEVSITYPLRYRVRVKHPLKRVEYHLEVTDDYLLLAEPADLMESVPESVFGVMLGMASGLMEAQKLLSAREKTDAETLVEGVRSDWRAPCFSYALRTATGSPFAERWGFAVQESAMRGKRFRIWVEQQRTGKELQLFLRQDGAIEGMQELEELPAAIHGVGIGMLMGVNHALQNMQQAIAKGEVMDAAQQTVPVAMERSLSRTKEAELEAYMQQLRRERVEK